MSVYTIRFRGIAEFWENDGRVEALAQAMERVGENDPEALFVMPAGFITADSEFERDRWAKKLAAAAEASYVGLIFGIDFDPTAPGRYLEEPARAYGYAVDRARQLIWAAEADLALSKRTVTIGAQKVMMLFGNELFRPACRAAVRLTKPDLVVVLAHGGPTRGWIEPLEYLNELAPTLVVHHALEVRRRPTPLVPRGFVQSDAGSTVMLTCYRREGDGATTPAVGH